MSIHAPELVGQVDAAGLKIGIVVSRFNSHITEGLVEGAVKALLRHGAAAADVRTVWVPGAFEIGAAATRMAASGRFDAIVCLGCVIRGETPHFDYICQGLTWAVSRLAQQAQVGVGFGVLTVDNETQALERVGGRHGHKGEEAALTAVAMARLLKSMEA